MICARATERCFGVMDVFTRVSGIKEFNMAKVKCILWAKIPLKACSNTICL
jgi:hypothetical protein